VFLSCWHRQVVLVVGRERRARDDQQGEAHYYDKDDSLKQYKSPRELRKETIKEGCWDGEVEADGEEHRHMKQKSFFAD
jgi:hypothetical protein